MAVPNYLEHVRSAKDRWPDAWRQAHTNSPQTEDFIRLLASYLHYEVDQLCGLNGKRGNERDLSDDVICYRSPGKSRDVRTGESVSVIDVIGSAGSSSAHPTWGEVWDAANLPTPATWVKPARIHDGVTPTPNPNPTPNPTPQPTPPKIVIPEYEAIGGDQFFWRKMGDPLGNDYLRRQPFDPGASVWFGRVFHRVLRFVVNDGMTIEAAMDKAVKEVQPEWRAALGTPEGGW